ncbi:bsr7700 [Bradyrhizobium diazoefficiens USDA 110]|uniref:Bsr7700 protein n=1 Tax=Bradyrhizobium diazoefficiens (strain JCM 10833 / BCRC 13528 / IAM 13628 / NBRC 14792 / USDA 110) TaxID=224911 RepID=Q89CU5_BRADU|nr:hypothetical protein CO678_41685 [Bradyrhizobium diazoefficiens]QBP26438.1 hypothetical protein Bdiaspc4_40710 [Bradyrhizobium diazoefficiens]QHP73141.1 hypothetical protein EI171_41495 [Bradyrhizobium sp. LCT2]BAC52965.1 bsr7700 [Bradyrhizobium diazoefficiens USDA 110]
MPTTSCTILALTNPIGGSGRGKWVSSPYTRSGDIKGTRERRLRSTTTNGPDALHVGALQDYQAGYIRRAL